MAEVSSPQSDAAGMTPAKQAACLTCRRSKMKCHRDGQSTCQRCQKLGTECVVPSYHIGRHKGVKNKRTGLEKAVHQVEEALRKSNAGNLGLDLQDILLKSTKLGGGGIDAESQSPPSSSFQFSGTKETPRTSEPAYIHSRSRSVRQNLDNIDLADAENPLQLLAQTSELLLSPDRAEISTTQASASVVSPPGAYAPATRSDGFQQFFARFRPRNDIGEDIDPIDLGLITISESETLFDFFFQNLAHTRWGVDPVIHTASFVRSRSSFLFSSICAASALFVPTAAAISKRMATHTKKLAQNVIKHRYRSVEIVLAFMVNIPWLSGNHWADDDTCAYISDALTIAMDLSLHKVIKSSQMALRHGSIASADCVSAEKALQLDGFDDVEPDSDWGRRLLRRRERAWLSLFVLERGVCLARGRNNTLPLTALVENCDHWHISDIADSQDGAIISIAVLRRELAGLVSRVRKLCDDHQTSGLDGAETTNVIQREIEGFFGQWYSTWPFQVGSQTALRLPPYVEILASHTQLSLYSSVINHHTAPAVVKHFFHAAGLASALNVMRAAVQGESQLKSMPNNTAIMISFAACFALELSAMADNKRAGLAPSVQNLILETADALERIGSTPEQRKGASVHFAKQLRGVVESSAQRGADHVAVPQINPEPYASRGRGNSAQNGYQPGYGEDSQVFFPAEPVIFSGMSNDEIVEAINNVGQEMSWADFQFGDGANLDWLDWTI